MQKNLFIKIVVLALLFLGLQIPLVLTQDVVSERASYRDIAVADVAQAQAGEQNLLGPVLVVPYRRDWIEHSEDSDGNPVQRPRREDRFLTVLPEQLQIIGDTAVEVRERGIFPVPVYLNTLDLRGRFRWPQHYGRAGQGEETITWQQPYVAVGISSQRGLKQVGPLRWNEVVQPFAPGSGLGELLDGQGIRATVPLNANGGDVEFRIDLKLAGTQQFSVLPLGEQTTLQLASNWPHPRFTGAQLPDQRSISEAGFSARWQTSHLATNLGTNWQRCMNETEQCRLLWDQLLSVALHEPVDVYLLSERALKYGFLFLGITFAAFFLLELQLTLPVHPIQYGMVGLALGMFFLLLISLAEQIGFALAYTIAAFACISLISFYLVAVLKARTRALGFAVLLAALYGALYAILQLEDVALLIGASLLFVLLTVVMALTRKVDWYGWRTPAPDQKQEQQPVNSAAPVAEVSAN